MRRSLAPRPATPVGARDHLHLRAIVPARAGNVLIGHEAGHERAPDIVDLGRARNAAVAGCVELGARAPCAAVVVGEHVGDLERPGLGLFEDGSGVISLA